MYPEIDELCVLLKKYNVQFWLSMGNLLLHVRDKKIVKRGEDLDFGISSDSVCKLNKALKELDDDYFIKRITVNKKLVSIKLFPKNSTLNPIDFSIFYINLVDDNLWCILPVKHPDSKNRANIFLYKILNYIYTKYLMITNIGGYPCPTSLPSIIPFSLLYKYSIFSYSSNIIFPLNEEEQNIPLPCRSDLFLSETYGEWRVPVKKWDFWYDQKNLKKLSRKRIENKMKEIENDHSFE